MTTTGQLVAVILSMLGLGFVAGWWWAERYFDAQLNQVARARDEWSKRAARWYNEVKRLEATWYNEVKRLEATAHRPASATRVAKPNRSKRGGKK